MKARKRVFAALLTVVSLMSAGLQSPSHAAPPPAATSWVITSSNAPSKCLEVEGQSQANSAQVQIWTCQALAHRLWHFEQLSNGYYHIWNDNSGKCMNVQGGSTANSAKIIQFSCQGVGTTNDQWTPQLWSQAPTGDYYRLVNRKSGKCLNVQGGLSANGTDLIQFDCSPVSTNNIFTWF